MQSPRKKKARNALSLMSVLPVLLAACSTAYEPEPIEIVDQARYAADVAFCKDAGGKHKAKLNVANIAVSAAQGAGNNASGAILNPLAPVLGAAGGASNSLITGLDVMGHASANVVKHCLEEKTHRDGSALLANPND